MSMTIAAVNRQELSPVLREILIAVMGSATIAVLAQLTVPVGPVPITGQTLAVLGLSWSLGRVRAVRAVTLYLAKGALGLPVFAGGTSGLLVLTGPTSGYLLGFLLAAVVVGALSDLARRRTTETSPAFAWLTFLAGTAAVYVPGLLLLSRFVPEGVLAAGLLPFLPGDIMKLFILVGLLPGLNLLKGAR